MTTKLYNEKGDTWWDEELLKTIQGQKQKEEEESESEDSEEEESEEEVDNDDEEEAEGEADSDGEDGEGEESGNESGSGVGNSDEEEEEESDENSDGNGNEDDEDYDEEEEMKAPASGVGTLKADWEELTKDKDTQKKIKDFIDHASQETLESILEDMLKATDVEGQGEPEDLDEEEFDNLLSDPNRIFSAVNEVEKDTDINILIDVSGSMREYQKWDAVCVFIDNLKEASKNLDKLHIKLGFFNHNLIITDYGKLFDIQKLRGSLDYEIYPKGGTHMGDSIKEFNQNIVTTNRNATIVITDASLHSWDAEDSRTYVKSSGILTRSIVIQNNTGWGCGEPWLERPSMETLVEINSDATENSNKVIAATIEALEDIIAILYH